MDLFGKFVNGSSTYVVDSLLEELNIWRLRLLSCYKDDGRIRILEVEVELLKLFLMCVGYWSNADKGRVGELGCLVLDLEAAFKEAMMDFRVAYSKKGTERTEQYYLNLAVSKLRQKLTLSRPQIKPAYHFVSKYYSFQPDHPLSNSHLWIEFYYFLRYNLQLCCQKGRLLEHVKPQFDVMDQMLESLHSFIFTVECYGPKLHGYRDLLTHFGAVLVQAAHVLYMCWVDRMDRKKSREMVVMLSDLMKKFKPNTPQITELCIKLLKALSSQVYFMESGYWAEQFVEFLIPENSGLATLRNWLYELIMFVIHAPVWSREGTAKLLLIDITAAISELGSFGYSFHGSQPLRADMRIHPALFRLLEKMELLRAEVFVTKLLRETVSWKFLEQSIDSFHEGLLFLRTSHGDASQGNSKIPKHIWIHIEPMAMEATSFCKSFKAKSITRDRAKNELFQLLEKIKLLKTEILLEDLLNNHPTLIANVKNQIESFDDELIVLKTFLMGPLEKNEKLILRRAEEVARDAASIYYSFRANTEDTMKKFSLLLPKVVQEVKLVNAEIKEIYLPVRNSAKANFPKTNGFGFMDFLLGYLTQLLSSLPDSIVFLKQQILVVHREIEFFRSLLKDTEEHYNEHSHLKNLVSRIIEMALEAEYIIDSFVVGDSIRWYHTLWLSDLIEDIQLIKIQASKISRSTHSINIRNVLESSRKAISPTKTPKIDEVVVDLADQNKLMIDRLTRGSLKQDVVSIVGMPGLGKTTLARKVYNDPLVAYHFHIRAWCCVSHVYRKRELLLQILGDIVDLTDNVLEMSDEDLDMELYQCLKRKRFLIVMDDMWSIEAWNDLQRSFPNDENGSRILITSRLPDMAVQIKADSVPHRLRLLSDDESWKLLQKKLFDTEDCPYELMTVGKQIARSCEGLPLAVVAIAGLLKRTDMILDWWKQVAESICSRIVDDPETRCMDILEISYKHLPDYLKPCFLYLGAFLEDKEIPVAKVTWLWAAEGFIRNMELESIEDVAEGYLRDLIGRSLVIVCKRRSNGGVKTCRVHDMLRTLCLLKCKEESFLQCITGYDERFASSSEDFDYGVDPHYRYPTNSIKYEKRRLSICSKRNHFVMSRPSGPHVHSLLYFATSDSYPRCPYDISFIFDNFKLLRVLDMECINMGNSFPSGIEFLVHLRYLALCGDIDSIPESVGKLWNLETLLVKGLKGKVLIPDTIWSLAKLRHLHVNNHAVFCLQDGKIEISSQLENLVSLSSPSLVCGEDTEDLMRRLPKLRKLRCVFSESRDDAGNWNKFPVLDFLTELESLKVLYSGRIAHSCKFDFPIKLKKLTLSKLRLPWDYISEIGRLPNLEVLKLLTRAFEGKVWDMKEGEFLRLKFLKLDSLNIAQWSASDDHLPKLQHLILRNCRQLEEVPSGLGDICTLEMIEVHLCRRSAEESVRRLKEEQLEMGNELKVLIDRSDLDF